MIAVASVLAYITLYNAARGVTAPSLANAFALVVTAIANTAANRRFTFARAPATGSAFTQS